MNGKTVCECGRDDIHSSKDCWTIIDWVENDQRDICKRVKALNELAKQAQELDMGYDNEIAEKKMNEANKEEVI